MERKKIRNILKFILKLSITVLLIWLVFRKINYKEVRSIFLESNPIFIFLAFVFLVLSQIVSAWRLTGFLHAIKIPISFGSNLRLYFTGLFYNSFLPGGIGGDGYKIYFLHKRYQKPAKKIITSILSDRVSGLWAICILGSLFLALLPVSFVSGYLILFIVIVLSVVYFILARYFFPDYADYFITGHIKALLAQSLQVLSIVMILLSQRLPGNFIPYLFSFLLSSVATAIPVSIGGAGVREYVMMNLANPLHIDSTLAVFTTLTFYVLSLLIAVSGPLFSLVNREWNTAVSKQEPV